MNDTKPLLQVGDKIVHYSNAMRAENRKPVWVHAITRVTPTRAIYGEGRKDWVKRDQPPATEQELVAAKEYRELESARYKAAKEAAALLAADPRLSLADELRGGSDFLPWDKLSLEQLQTIRKWMDEAKGE